jgi:thioredoxin reductase (NADPH)
LKVGYAVTTTDPAGAVPVFPPLTPHQFEVLSGYGVRNEVASGDVLYSAGDAEYDFIVVESAEVEVVRPAMPGAPEAPIALGDRASSSASSISSRGSRHWRPRG